MRLPRGFWLGLLICSLGGCAGWLGGCSGWDPTDPFTRNAPEVDEAIALLDAGELESAQEVLQTYLGTGPCAEGVIDIPERDSKGSIKKPDGSFDLGLVLFHLAERYGQRFGDEELADGGAEEQELAEERAIHIGCALILAKAIGSDANVSAELRARAYYLAGNLEFLRSQYQDAVTQYDKALEIVPGLYPEAGGDDIGRDAAWNRAIALRRIAEEDAGAPDAEPDADPEEQEPDAGDDAGDQPDAGQDGSDEPDGGGDDQSADGGGEDAGDDGTDAGEDEQEEQPSPDELAEPPESSGDPQIDRMLDELEQAPTYQEEDAKQRAARARQRPVMEDK